MKLTVVVTLKNLAVCWELRMKPGTRHQAALAAEEGGSKNPWWTDNQQERLERCRFENPQRLYARPSDGMRQSDLHGNVQSAAEMTAPAPARASNKAERS